jgi:hypothetical protein
VRSREPKRKTRDGATILYILTWQPGKGDIFILTEEKKREKKKERKEKKKKEDKKKRGREKGKRREK